MPPLNLQIKSFYIIHHSPFNEFMCSNSFNLTICRWYSNHNPNHNILMNEIRVRIRMRHRVPCQIPSEFLASDQVRNNETNKENLMRRLPSNKEEFLWAFFPLNFLQSLKNESSIFIWNFATPFFDSNK